MANCRSTNFDIAVHGHTPPYAVRATYGPLAAEGLLEIDSCDAFWVDRLTWLDPVGAPPGPAILAETGARLFQALFRERVRELWLRAQADLASGTADAIRLRLSLTPALVAALPWEALKDSSTALGAQLLQTGMPAGVAMQFAVGATAARQFSEVFYQELLASRCPGQIDAAMSAARGSLYLVDQTTFSYGTPVLWLNAPDGRIFTADRPLRLRPVAVMPSPPTLAELADLAAQVDAVRTWLANQPDLSRATTNAILRNLVNQQQERLRMVGDLLDQISTHPGTRAELASAAAKLSAIREHRRAADRLTDLIQANQEPPSG